MALCAARGTDLYNLRRNQRGSFSISLLKNFDKGNNSTLCNPSGPLVRSALSSLPTRKSKFRKDFPFPFGIEVYHRLQLPKCLCVHGSLVS